MAQVIKIKRSTGNSAPGSLNAGELAYTGGAGTAGNSGSRLFVGNPADGTNLVIGGKYYTDLFSQSANGTIVADKLVTVDSNKKVNEWKVDNLTLDGNTIAATGNLILTHGGTIQLTGQANEITIPDNQSAAFDLKEGSTSYFKLVTTNDAERVEFGQDVRLNGKKLAFDADDDTYIQSSIDDLLAFYASGTAWLLASASVGLTPTGSSVPLGSSSTPWSVLHVDNIKVDGNAITSENTNGDITITPNGSGKIVLDGINFPTADGSANQFLQTDGSGQLSFATVSSSFTISNGAGSNDTFTTGQTLTFAAGEGIDTAISDNTVTISAENASTTNKGVASFDSTDFSVSSGAVSVNAITLGSSSLNPGATTSTLAGLGSIAVDNVTIDGNTVSTTNSNGNLTLSPNGTGTVVVPSGYKDRAGFGTNSLVTKEYVDALKQALDIKDSVVAATTANLAGTYNNGAGTLTNSASNAALTFDGVTFSANDRVLVKSQTASAQNGIYVVTTVGDGSTAWVLTRADDANTSAELTGGTFVFVEQGTVNGDNGFVFTHNGAPTLGTTALTVVQFSGAGQVIAGTGLTKSGNTINAVGSATINAAADSLNIKGISATAVGDILIGQASNAGFTALAKPSAAGALLNMNTSGTASWSNVIDGGTF